MKIKYGIGFCLTALLMISSVACAKDVLPGKYSLSVAEVYGSRPRESVFILGGTSSIRGGETVCKSVASLKKLLSGLPLGSTLDWFPTCVEPAILKDNEIEDLKATCTKAGVVFTIHPSG